MLFELEDPESGATTLVHVEASFSGQDRPGVRLIGSTGELQIGSPITVTDPFGNTHEVATQQPITGYAIAEGKSTAYSGFVGAVREMCRCVQDGAKPIYDAERASEAMALVGAAYLSELREGKRVTLDDFKDYALELQKQEGARATDVFIKRVSEHLARHTR